MGLVNVSLGTELHDTMDEDWRLVIYYLEAIAVSKQGYDFSIIAIGVNKGNEREYEVSAHFTDKGGKNRNFKFMLVGTKSEIVKAVTFAFQLA